MPQTFAIRSNEIASFLGTALLSTDEIAVISPWVSDIQLEFPTTNRFTSRDLPLTLSEAVRKLDDTSVSFYVDPENDDHNRDRSYALLPRIKDHAEIHEIDNLHAKAILTDGLVYQGSANLTYNGLNVNVELCDIRENEFGSIPRFLSERLGINE